MAITPSDFARSERFYAEVMGFALVKAVKRQAPGEGAGWTKHVFFETGHGSFLALWDLRLTDLEPGTWNGSLAEGLNLPWWTNHIAFSVPDQATLDERREHWLRCGQRVTEVDHEFIKSIYTRDPDGTLVEFTLALRELTPEDMEEAIAILQDDSPALIPEYAGTTYYPDGRVRTS